jgi:hypothetical protein
MDLRRMTIGLMAIGLGALVALGLLTQASAQYPPPNGTLVLTSADGTPDLDSDVLVSAVIQDQNGDPAADVECTFAITDQPGTDAEVDAGPFTTDAEGNISTTLSTGSTAGTIVVEATCGTLSAEVSVVAGETATPPASLPTTGTGVSESSTDWAFWALIAMGGAVALSGMAVAWRRFKAKP